MTTTKNTDTLSDTAAQLNSAVSLVDSTDRAELDAVEVELSDAVSILDITWSL